MDETDNQTEEQQQSASVAGQPYSYLSQDIERRAHALSTAAGNRDPYEESSVTVNRARAYYAFLNGEQTDDANG